MGICIAATFQPAPLSSTLRYQPTGKQKLAEILALLQEVHDTTRVVMKSPIEGMVESSVVGQD
jgi:hypothetical protein